MMRLLMATSALTVLGAACASDNDVPQVAAQEPFPWTYTVCGTGLKSNDCAPVAKFVDEYSCLAHLRLSQLACDFEAVRDGIVPCRETSGSALPSNLASTARCVPTPSSA